MAYNNALTVAQLTQDLLELFSDAGATDPEQALAAFAEVQAHIEGDQFEALLGPLSATSEALGYLPGLAALAQAAGAPDVVHALDVASTFLGEVHRLGLAITLGHIADRSTGGDYDGVVWRLARELIDLGNASDLTLATLNYDGLLHAGMMDAGRNEWGVTVFHIVDLAAGYAEGSRDVVPGHHLVGHQLREIDDLILNRAALLQLHGSLGWLRDPADPSAVWRFELGDLREVHYWQECRNGNTDWQPVVVLTDRKERAISKWPFSLAYEIFLRRLISAQRWLIMGYGLGDVPVNATFKTAIHERNRLKMPHPKTLVVGYTPNPDDLRLAASNALGIPVASITASGAGVPGVFDTVDWTTWAA